MFRIFTFGLLTGLALDLCSAQQSSNNEFSCKGRPSGYYADVNSGCQLYHMCDGLGRQFSYTCPNATLFQQRMLVCDHWYMVNCSRSEGDYSANLLIGQKKPFVEDSSAHPYSRTPRPDLLTHPSSESEYNIIYRTGKNYKPSKNIVGIEDEQQSTSADEPTYYPPSHWSTEYPSRVTTAKPIRGNLNGRRPSNVNKQIPPSRTSNQYNENRRNSNQNYEDRNYPSRTGQSYNNDNYNTRNSNSGPGKIKQAKAINIESSNRNGNNEIGNNIRGTKYKTNNYKYNGQPNEDPVNYKSSFQATTPVNNQIKITTSAPSVVAEVTPTSTEVPVNYKSNFKATTPVFPITVEDSSIAPNEIGILPPIPYRNSKPEDKSSEVDNKSSESSYRNPDGDSNENDKDEPRIIFQSKNEETASDRSDQVNSQAKQGLNTIPVQQAVEKSDQPVPNFKSNFKATTPVYPTFVNVKTKSSGIEDVEDKNDEPSINFKSDFKATTPVYPSAEEVKKLDIKTDYSSILETPPKKQPPVNFVSDFKATTPVYPTSVEPTSPNPGEVGLLAPHSNTSQLGNEISKSDVPTLSLSIEPPKFDETYKKDPAHLETTVRPPSMFYQPPNVQPDYTSDTEIVAKPGIEIENIMKNLTRKQWQNLRQRFHIPEYEFPLDEATRPSYDSSLNSFSAKAAEKR